MIKSSQGLPLLGSLRGWIPSLLVVGVVWFAVIRILWNDWLIDPQYSYGILVPLLVIGLLWKRFEDRPLPIPPQARPARVAAGITLISAALLAFVIPMAEVSPDWRPLGVAATCSAVAICLTMIFRRGGWPWLGHFAFPVCFFLIAVPWPRNLEQALMSSLMSWNTMTTMEILHWSGFEATSQGNLIVLPAGVLGMEEACSGIRSLQSGLMTALFFGEIFRLTVSRRVLLLAVSLLAALLGNILRTSLLALVASSEGLSAVPAWHDPAGVMVLLSTVGAVAGCAFFWRNEVPLKVAPVMTGTVSDLKPVAGILPGMIVLLLVMGSLIATQLWFRSHEMVEGVAADWSLRPRTGVPGTAPVPISPTTLRMLLHPEGFSERWITSDGAQGQVFYFRWPAGRTAMQAVTMHNPEICLSSIGMRLQKPLSTATFESPVISLPFRTWLFEDHGRQVYVFHSLLEDGDPAGTLAETVDDSVSGRLRNLLSGHANRGKRMVEIAFWNLPDEEAARRALFRYLSEAMTTASPAATPMGRQTEKTQSR